MAETVMATVLLLLAVFGFVQGVRRLVLLLMCPAAIRCGVWVIPLKGHREDAEFLVRRLSACRIWNALPAEEIYIVDAGADTETAEVACRASKALEVVKFIPRDKAKDFLVDFFEK